jgi:folate-binding protein YgfZ
VPTVLPATSDHFVPQMANLDLLGGISFNKGCYTGQEIVARMHYLGQLKRRLFWARTAARDVEAGATVYDGDGAQAVGEVMQTAVDGDGTLLGVVMQLSHAGSEALHLGGDHRVRVSQPQKPPGLAIAS